MYLNQKEKAESLINNFGFIERSMKLKEIKLQSEILRLNLGLQTINKDMQDRDESENPIYRIHNDGYPGASKEIQIIEISTNQPIANYVFDSPKNINVSGKYYFVERRGILLFEVYIYMGDCGVGEKG